MMPREVKFHWTRFAVVAVLIAVGLPGCVVVKVQTELKGEVEVTTHFGVVSMELKPAAGAILAEATGFGLIKGVEGFVLGYHSANVSAIAGDRCQLVLWIMSNEQLQELDMLLRDRKDLCVVWAESSKMEKP